MRPEKKKVSKKKVRKKKVSKKKAAAPKVKSFVRTLSLTFNDGEEIKEANRRADQIKSELSLLAAELACGRLDVNAGAGHLLRLSDRVGSLKKYWNLVADWSDGEGDAKDG